jgi:tagatose-1,6-bisphosphate aldolase non-catalytic subunit AgaZ/GatZ
MDYARELFAEDLNAGFDILHVDATEDPRRSDTLELEETADRTSQLVSDIESYNDTSTRPPLYEVGTEEIAGGMTQPEDFGRFLKVLTEHLEDETHSANNRLLFAVGQVGTTMRIDMENEFDPKQTAELVDVAADYGVYLKTHYTDWLDTPVLERFPNLGVGAANVGPEFSAALIAALFELDERERKRAATSDGSRSEFSSILKQTAIDEAPWQKFAPDNLSGVQRQEFLSNHRRNIALCVGRYVLGEPEVASAREQLYENVRSYTTIDPEAFVLERVQESIHRYVEAFNLSNSLEV